MEEITDNIPKPPKRPNEKKLKKVQNQLGELQKEFLVLQAEITKATVKPDHLSHADAVFNLYDRFLHYFSNYQTMLQQAELMGIIEPEFQQKYEARFAKAAAYEFVEVKKDKPFPPVPRYDDEANKIFYQVNRDDHDHYLSYSILGLDKNETQGFISFSEANDLLNKKGFLADSDIKLQPKDLLTILFQRGHAAPRWEDNPYFLEFQEALNELNANEDSLTTISQITNELKKLKESVSSKTEDYLLVGLVLSMTLIVPIIAFIAYKIDVDYVIKNEISKLEERNLNLINEYKAKENALIENFSQETPLKQDIYHHMRSINTLFKPFKDRMDKENKLPHKSLTPKNGGGDDD